MPVRPDLCLASTVQAHLVLGAMLLALVCAAHADAAPRAAKSAAPILLTLVDGARGRTIPVAIYLPSAKTRCAPARRCPVAVLSGGYGVSHFDYAFLARALTTLGYLVVSIQHDLPTDAALATTGDLVALRTPVWQRGGDNIRFAHAVLAAEYPGFAWDAVLLIGHSNGGDISTWLADDEPGIVAALITLDHRRMPLPRASAPRMLSIRAGDFPADPGVLPTPEEQRLLGLRVVTITGARHDDMNDAGSSRLKRAIVGEVRQFLKSPHPPSLH
jgi:pimeloyl-ACP methyl ester carboxylesterase